MSDLFLFCLSILYIFIFIFSFSFVFYFYFLFMFYIYSSQILILWESLGSSISYSHYAVSLVLCFFSYLSTCLSIFHLLQF
jgi:hypothetical protein